MVHWRLHTLVIRVWVGRLVRDPGDVAGWQSKDLRCLTTDVSKLDSIKGATLQVETIKLDGSILVKLTVLERADELQLVDSDLEHSC